MKITKVLSARFAGNGEDLFRKLVEAWITQPFNNWKKAVEKMRAHSQSDGHIQSCEAQLAADTAVHQGSVFQQLQQVGERERLKE